jgi:hypothetical protein
MRNVYKILFRKPDGKGPHGRLRYRWKDNVRMDLREIRWLVVDWIHLTQDRNQSQALMNTVRNIHVP